MTRHNRIRFPGSAAACAAALAAALLVICTAGDSTAQAPTGGGGATANAPVLDLQGVTDVDAFCRTCHPDAGEAVSEGQTTRCVHASGLSGDGWAVTCESCHTAHKDTGNPRFAVAPFRASSDLCWKCHSRGHAVRGISPEPCLSCHSLRVTEVETGTSHISAASRTLPAMKSLSDGKAPEVFGCTYCHSNPLNRDMMKGVLLAFGAATSKHPVGHDFRNGRDTMNEYLSSTATSFADELDCVDCHDPALLVDPSPANGTGSAPYANHVPLASEGRAANRAMLRAASPDDLCRTCHGRDESFAKADAAVQSHDDRDLKESDGTPLKTSECSACHNAHSSNGQRLFRDGREGGTAIQMGDPKQCSAVCHQRGDSLGNYDLHGHGKEFSTRSRRPMMFGCGSCHSVDAGHNGQGPKMLNFEADGKTSRYGTSLTSVCYICHREYRAHMGEGGAGCLDCHDEHAEGSGGDGGEKANIFMIPRDLPRGAADSEPAVFEKAGEEGYDYYRAGGDGLCDNALCHGGIKAPSGAPLAPLSGLMKGGKHGGGDILQPGSDCGECHNHESKEGSWSQ